MLRTMIVSWITILFCANFYYSIAQAAPLPQPPDTVPNFVDDTLLNKDIGLNALVRLERVDGNVCTGIAIRTNENPNSPAFVVSAGHCHWLLYGEVVTDLIPKGSKKIKALFNQFHDATAAEKFTINVKKISYASMRGHDLAIFELDTTQGQLAAKNILLPKLGSSIPTGLSVTTYGSRAHDPLMRAVNCTLEDRVNLNEGKWLWWDVLRAECPNAELISGGASGSPVYIQGRANELFGILNTINPMPIKNILCSDNNPCELKQPRPISRLKSVYLMDVHKLKYCFNANGSFNHQLKYCPLPKKLGRYTAFKRLPDPSITISEQIFFDQQSRYPNPSHSQTNYIFRSTLATQAYQMQLVKPANSVIEAYRYKLTPLANFDPYDPSSYSEPTKALSFSLPYPHTAGTYIASVVPAKNFNTIRLNPLALYTDIFEIVYKNPLKIEKLTLAPSTANFKKITIDKISGNQMLANSLQFLGFHIGKKAETSCFDFKKYIQTAYTNPMKVELGPVQSGDKLCLVLVDRALNASEPYEYIRP